MARHQPTHLIETGYGLGHSCRAALRAGFQRVLSCEILPTLHAAAIQSDRVSVAATDSVTFLRSAAVTQALASHRCLVFLGAHYPGADHAGESFRATSRPARERHSLLAEIEALRGSVDNAALIIDDVRIFRRDFKVAQGVNPDSAEKTWVHEAEFMNSLQGFGASHSLHWHTEETGYAVLWPLAWGPYDFQKWVLPGDETNSHALQLGVPGTTCISLNRRMQDARFASRWLVGKGLDIGGGPDSIGLYRGLFPRIEAVTVYDWAQGDAQHLSNVHDDSFDFVYSSHCLEHVVDPRVALQNWLRVLKTGGYMVIAVPDEDLYEQGVWPSTFNDDHKHTFTIFKRKSWSPASINVLEMLQVFSGEVGIEKIELLNHAFLPGYVRFDQTRTAFGECGIEVVLKKA